MTTLLSRLKSKRESSPPVGIGGDAPTQRMECMEVWGGTQLTERGVQFGGLDAWVFSRPYGQARCGGDIYYASSCATGRIVRLLLADVAGHGKAVARTAANLRTLMRRFVNCLDQREFVRLLNSHFMELPREEAFATALVATFFVPTRRLTLCNAGHPRPLLYRVAQRNWELVGERDATMQRSGPCNLPFGILRISDYEHLDVELEPGDCLLAYTDALLESHDADGEMLGEDGMLRILRLLGHVEPQDLIKLLLQEIAQRYPENLCNDDVTVLLVRATGREAAFRFDQKLGALGRFSKTLLSAMMGGPERPPFPDAKLANIGGAIIPALGRRWRAGRGQSPTYGARNITRTRPGAY